jgi:chlorobactene glucosyltransferase
MLFRAREYRQHQFHRLVKDVHVEDIHIVRKVKAMGYRAQTLLSRGEISCRMYDSFRSGVAGFTRSVFAFFGGSALIMILFTLFTTFGFLLVWLGLSLPWALAYLIVSAMLRMGIFRLSRQPVVSLLFLSPLIQCSFLWIVITSLRLRFRGENTWKGRTIKFKGI